MISNNIIVNLTYKSPFPNKLLSDTVDFKNSREQVLDSARTSKELIQLVLISDVRGARGRGTFHLVHGLLNFASYY